MQYKESAVDAILSEHMALLFERLEERLKDEPEECPFTEDQRNLILMQVSGISADLFIEYNLQDLIRSSKNRR